MADTSPTSHRLTSWKDIAAYLDRDVRTVMRWEKQGGMPVHRVPGGQRHSVFAYTHELNEWLNDEFQPVQREDAAEPQPEPLPTSDGESGNWRERRKTAAGVALLCLIAALGAFAYHSSQVRPKVSALRLQNVTRNGSLKLGLETDGSTVYFSEYIEGRLTLTAVSTQSGSTRHVPTPFINAQLEDLSPDGKSLLVSAFEGFESERELWIVPLPDGEPRRIRQARVTSAAWLHDGKSIAYSSGESIYLTSDEGATTRLLQSFDSRPEQLRCAKDGKHLRFLLRNLETWDISAWEISLDDQLQFKHRTRIELKDGCCSTWSKDFGSQNEFVMAVGDSGHGRLWLAESAKGWWAESPKVTDAGTLLRGIGDIAVDPRSRKTYLIGIASILTDEMIRLTPKSHEFVPFLPGVSAVDLDYSRDGRYIAYVTRPDFNLWVSRADGSEARLLADSYYDLELPRWSPDGKQIAFMARTPGRPWRIFVMPASGGTPREASEGNENQGAPTWSPDGKFLVYGGVYCQSHSCAVRRIELSKGKIDKLPDSDGLTTARWSPSGRYIAAHDADMHELLLFDWRTRKWTKLADGITGNDISWSADSRFIYTNRPSGTKPALLRISVPQGKVETEVELAVLNKLNGKIDSWFCVAPDGSIIIVRWLAPAEVYSLDLTEN